jgi:hypothetical protein
LDPRGEDCRAALRKGCATLTFVFAPNLSNNLAGMLFVAKKFDFKQEALKKVLLKPVIL